MSQVVASAATIPVQSLEWYRTGGKRGVVADVELGRRPNRETCDMDVYPVLQTAPSFGEQTLGGNMKVTFKDLDYVVTSNANRKERILLLNKVSGFLLPGRLSALMGPSGSSKTTLLDVLAGRKTVGTVRGTILFAGQHATKIFLRRYTGYVEQFDALIENLTVYEMLIYTAELKIPNTQSLQQKKDKVDAVINQLALNTCKNVRIGSTLSRGISGGQSKRTNIGIALVTNPRVLFLDEPTSGLDSYTANEVMSVVKGLVKSGITICATIHSPTPYCFNLFDSLMILLRGHVVYFGDNGPEAVRYFESVPGVQPLSRDGLLHNKAEWMVDLTTKADREGRWMEFADLYNQSELKQINMEQLEAHMHDGAPVSPQLMQELAVSNETTNPFLWGVYILLKYRFVRDIQDPSFLGPRILDKFLLSLIIMSLYWKVGANKEPSNLNNITAVLFLWTILPGYAAASYMPTIVMERPLYVRERNDGLYRPITYLVAKMIEELSIFFLLSLVLTSLVFFPLKLGGEYLVFWLCNLVTTATGIALGYFIAAVSPNMDVANAALPAYVTVLLFFVGLLLRPQDQPKYWSWFAYINFLKYAWAAQMVNQYEHQPSYLPSTGRMEIHNPDITGHVLMGDGRSVLAFYNLDDKNKWSMLGYESLFFFGFLILAWASLAYLRHVRR